MSTKKRRDFSAMSEEELERTLAEMPDDEIDYSDIPPLDDDFFDTAQLVEKQPRTERISIRIEVDVLEWLRLRSPHYQTLINKVLRTYVQRDKERIFGSEETDF